MIYEEPSPAEHLLRKLSAAVDLSFVWETVGDCYCPDTRTQLITAAGWLAAGKEAISELM